MHTIVIATASDRAKHLQTCLGLRRTVFIHEQAVPEDLEIDGLDAACVHVLVTDDDGAAIGTARMKAIGEAAKVQRVAVAAAWRKRGVGRVVMAAVEAEARRRGHRQAVLSSQTSAIGFYERLGYAAHGAVYEEAGIPHRDMTKAL